MSKTEFRQVDLDALGYPKGDIRDWLDAGHVKASIKQADGVGTRNVYSRADVLRIIALRALVSAGFTIRLAKLVVDVHAGYIKDAYPWIDKEGRSLSADKKRRELAYQAGLNVMLALGMHPTLASNILKASL